MTSVRLTKTQEKKIKESTLTKSEFIRRSVDYYIAYLENPYNAGLLHELEEWIAFKRNTIVTHNNTPVLHSNTSVTHTDTPVTICNTNNTDVLQNTSEIKDTTTPTPLHKKLAQEIPMLQRILKNTSNSGTIPDYTMKILTKKYDVSKSTIQGWIVENRDWILSQDLPEEEQGRIKKL